MIGIYKITNPKGAIYIGSSIEIEVRFSRYKKMACKTQPKIYNSLLKYGVENHKFEVIQECDVDELFKLENFYGIMYNCLDRNLGLNCLIPNIGDNKLIVSEENRKNRSIAQIGKKASLQTKLKQSKSQLGRKHKAETKLKMKMSSKNLKIILNIETGIYYFGTAEASFSDNINRHTLKNKLNGSKFNNSKFIYV